MHLLTVYLPLHHTPHQAPKHFFASPCLSRHVFFCHIWQILFTLGRHFLLECEIFSVVMATTSYYYGLHLSPALLKMSRFISVCRLYNARAGGKGWPSQVWYFLNSSQYCISVFCKHGHVLCEMHFKTLLLSLIVQNYMSIRLRIRPLSSSRLSWDEKNLVFIVVLILPSLIIFELFSLLSKKNVAYTFFGCLILEKIHLTPPLQPIGYRWLFYPAYLRWGHT